MITKPCIILQGLGIDYVHSSSIIDTMQLSQWHCLAGLHSPSGVQKESKEEYHQILSEFNCLGVPEWSVTSRNIV